MMRVEVGTMPRKTMVAITPWAIIMEWYPAMSLKRLPIPENREVRPVERRIHEDSPL
jgi:hypothetical protein